MQPQFRCLLLGNQGTSRANSVAEGPQSEGPEGGAAFPVAKDGREGASGRPPWRDVSKRTGGEGLPKRG